MARVGGLDFFGQFAFHCFSYEDESELLLIRVQHLGKVVKQDFFVHFGGVDLVGLRSLSATGVFSHVSLDFEAFGVWVDEDVLYVS